MVTSDAISELEIAEETSSLLLMASEENSELKSFEEATTLELSTSLYGATSLEIMFDGFGL